MAREPQPPGSPDALAAFARWTAGDGLADYPSIADAEPGRIYIRGGEALDLLRRAWLAAWDARITGG